MGSKEDSNKNQNYSSHYEDNSGDSDIESRLYAEIHYTNTIIGDESNSAKELSNNESENTTIREHSSAIPEVHSQSNQSNQSSNHVQSEQRVTEVVAQDNMEPSRFTAAVHENSVQSQSKSKSNSNSISKKRPLITDSHQDESNKKQKNQQDKSFNINDKNKIINPYNKEVNKQQYGMKLLSPAFLHLFFGKTKGKKKKVAQKKLNTQTQSTKVNVSNNTPVLNAPQKNVILKDSVAEQVIPNETEVNRAQDSETIIDISSESSNDSNEDNFKYNSIEATDKKLTKQNSIVTNENSDDETSDSNESIFEVPVPPKPAPPVIELNDSDNENNERSNSDNSSSSGDSYEANTQNIDKSISNITNNLQDQENSDSESEPDNLILNCTEIQKGVSNINDIRRMSHEISNETNTASTLNDSQKNLVVMDNIRSKELMPPPTKKINSSVTKQVSKSSQTKSRQDVGREKSFFQPMSDKMKSFYNDSWGGENFDLEILKSKMPRDPKKWAILDDDLTVSFSRRKRYFGMVCNRCQKEGHRQNQCPEPYKPPTCHMCGIKGHFETGCPERKCLTCGKKQNSYRKTCEQCIKMVCSRCKARGHTEYCCPDLWRSYHQTINNTKPKVPKNLKTVMKPQHSLYCCNCAKRGHDSQNCRKLRWSEHFPVPSHVISYNGPEYSKENVGSEINLNSSNLFCENPLTPSYSADKTTSRNLAQDKSNFPKNQIANIDNNFIFKIKSKLETEKLVKADFNLKIPNTNQPSMYNYWNNLSTFLCELVKDLPGEFLLRQNNTQVIMEMRVPRKNRVILEKLIQQYARRNNLERSYMYLTCDRNPDHMIQHLTNKFNEFKNMQMPKDILELYKELKSLKSENDQQVNACRNQKLSDCEKKLLYALFKEGCADDSFKRLKKIHNKLVAKMVHREKAASKKKLKYKGPPALTLKVLFDCLLHYNNVFVPYEPRNLHSFISTYKANLERRDRLRNNPLIFPQDSNNKNDKTKEHNNSFSSTVTTESVLTSSPSNLCQIPNLLLVNTSTISQIQPTVSEIGSTHSQIQPMISSDTPRPLLSINTSISSNFHFSQNPPAVNNNAKITSQNKEIPSGSNLLRNLKNLNFVPERGEKVELAKTSNNYKRFINKTNELIAQARNLNIPHVRKHAEILENKIKNGLFVYKKDAKMLRILVNKEMRHDRNKR